MGRLWHVGVGIAIVALGGCGGRRPAALSAPVQTTAQQEADRHHWQKPEVLVEALRLRPGMKVLDLGAGAGYLLPFLAQAVGPQGKVVAAEIQPELVRHLRARVARQQWDNVEVVTSTDRDVPLLGWVDRIVLLDTYRQLAEPVAMMAALKNWLRPGGRLLLVEARSDGSAVSGSGDELLDPDTVEAEARGAGLVVGQRLDILERQYALVFVHAEEVEPSAGAAEPVSVPAGGVTSTEASAN